MFTEFQRSFVTYHLRRPEHDIRISEIANIIAEEFNRAGLSVNPAIAAETALLMNLGELDERIAYIYDPKYSWKEHPEAIELNKLHGEYSVEIAKSIGIYLTEEQEKVITEHSKSEEYSTNLAKVIKIAEICRATETPRIYRGIEKQVASSWEEVKALLEEFGFSEDVITLTERTYGKGRFSNN